MSTSDLGNGRFCQTYPATAGLHVRLRNLRYDLPTTIITRRPGGPLRLPRAGHTLRQPTALSGEVTLLMYHY